MNDQGKRAPRLQHVVHDLGYAGLVGPVEGLTEGDQWVRSRCCGRKILGSSLNPADVRDTQFLAESATFGEHRGVGVETDRLLKQVGESDGEDAGTAAAVEEPPRPIQAQLPSDNSLKLRRIGRSTLPVMDSGAVIIVGSYNITPHHSP